MSFILGGLVLSPYVVVLSDHVGDRPIGTAYGWYYYLVAAVSTITVAWAAGTLLDLGDTPGRVLSCGLLAVVGSPVRPAFACNAGRTLRPRSLVDQAWRPL